MMGLHQTPGLPASPSWMLGLPVCTTISDSKWSVLTEKSHTCSTDSNPPSPFVWLVCLVWALSLLTHRQRQDKWYSRERVLWRRSVVGENRELKANFPNVFQCDFTFCDMVKQLERGWEEGLLAVCGILLSPWQRGLANVPHRHSVRYWSISWPTLSFTPTMTC